MATEPTATLQERIHVAVWLLEHVSDGDAAEIEELVAAATLILTGAAP